MIEKKIQIVVVEDNETMRDGLVEVLTLFGYKVESFERAETALHHLQTQTPDILVSDYKLPGITGLDLLEKMKSRYPEVAVVLITAFGSIELAVQAMQKGAADFITKPFSADEIGVKVERIIEQQVARKRLAKSEAENKYHRNIVDEKFNHGDIIGAAPAMQQVFKKIQKVAHTDASVIIYGESGTGKELVGWALHKNSHRREKPFIRVNCSALAEGLLESELFGHEKGAFTGAHRRKLGRFELAHEGTIFLDEIGEISPAMQVKLLRVLQEKEVERVGGETTIPVDVRIIAATNKNLEKEVEAGRFRDDLFYRLHIVPITLPPLRHRPEDIPLLAAHFLNRARKSFQRPDLELAPSAIKMLGEYHFPGNVRELENIIERAAVLSDSALLEADDLPLLVKKPTSVFMFPDDQLDLNETLAKMESALIEHALKLSHGVKAEAARKLGIKTTTLLYKISKYEMD